MSDEQPELLPVVEDEDTGDRLLIYQGRDGVSVNLRLTGESFWATQKQLAEALNVSVSVVSRHISNVFKEGELPGEGNLQKMQISRARPTALYSAKIAIAVGMRVGSPEATKFRTWAIEVLDRYLHTGFVVNKQQLKGQSDRITELRRIIRDIRADEANVYAELRRIWSMCRDYDPKSAASHELFAKFQNRMLYAITSLTAAEIIMRRADHRAPNMGMQTWGGDRDAPIQKDAKTAKNYLGPLEIEDLNRLTTMVLDFFEDQTERGWLVAMGDADQKLAEILAVNKRMMLRGKGAVAHNAAMAHAVTEYKKHRTQRGQDSLMASLRQLRMDLGDRSDK